MAAAYYPVMLKLDSQRTMVVGGGNIAARKVRGLLEGGAQSLMVVAPHLCESLQQLAEQNCIIWLNQRYEASVLQQATLVFAATDQHELNEQISCEALACGILVCNASSGEQGSFITPAIARGGELTVAISSGGGSPGLAKRLKQELELHYLPRYERAGQLLKRLRADVLASGSLNARQRQYMLEQAVVEAVNAAIENHSEQHSYNYDVWYSRLCEKALQAEFPVDERGKAGAGDQLEGEDKT